MQEDCRNNKRKIEEEEWDTNSTNSEENDDDWARFIERLIDDTNARVSNMEDKLANFGKKLEELRN